METHTLCTDSVAFISAERSVSCVSGGWFKTVTRYVEVLNQQKVLGSVSIMCQQC